MPVSRHVPRQLVYPLRKQRYLNLGGTGISVVTLELVYDLGLLYFFQNVFP